MPHTHSEDEALRPVAGALRTVTLDAGEVRSAEARELVRASLAPAIHAAAATLNDHPLSIAQLAAKMLLEQLFALDADAAQNWCVAVMAEERAQTDEAKLRAQRDRLAAFQQLAAAQQSADEKKRAGPFDLRLFI